MLADPLPDFTTAPLGPLHKRLAAGAYAGMLTDGYTIGIAGAYLGASQTALAYSSFWQGLIGAGAIFGMLFGSFFTGLLTDKTGRKQTYRLLPLLFIIISICQYWLSDPLALAIARFGLGMAIGSDYAVGITLLSEWSPGKQREKLSALMVVIWTIGYTSSWLAGLLMSGFNELAGQGRLILCTSALPAALTLAIRWDAPESPLWLIAKNRLEEAQALLKNRLGQYGLPNQGESEAESGSFAALFSAKQWRATTVSCVFFFCQALPFFAISLFLPLVLTKLNMNEPRLAGGLYNLFTLIGVCIGAWLYTILTRRAFLISTFYLAALLLALPLIWTSMPALLALAFVIAFALVIAIAVVAQFAYPAELFPASLRGSGVGLTITISGLGAGGGSFLLPALTQYFGVHAALWLCAGVLLFGGAVCQALAPETSGKRPA